MFRFILSFIATFLFFNGLNAQSGAASNGRHTTQQLSPSEAILHKETNELDAFSRKLTALKAAFAEKNASRVVAYEAYILRAMRNETDQMILKISAESALARSSSQIRLEKMDNILVAFEGHAFDLTKPEAAARDFLKLDEFLQLMRETLEK